MRYVYLIIFFQILIVNAFGQSITLKGSVNDAYDKTPLINATVTLLNAKDSILITDTYTNNAGVFNFGNLKSQKYILLVSYAGYDDKSLFVNLDNSESLDTILLTPSVNDLDAVTVQSDGGAIRIKGDTLEYNSKYFKVPKNANVEELLKRLPGISVDNNGKITAQGEEIKKILVNGDEFFSDDPTLVTNNLKANMVDKVQVFDKKSDQATFSGIDDGVREKTINLKLNKESNSGQFGSLDIGIGTSSKYVGRLTANKFTKNSKISLFGVKSNNGISGLTSVQNYQLGFNNGDDLYNGKGIPKIFKTGAHFDRNTKNGKHKFRLNYIYDNVDIKTDESSSVRNDIETAVLLNESSTTSRNKNHSNKGDFAYTFNMSPASYLKFKSDFNLTGFNSKSSTVTNNKYNSDSLLSTSQQQLGNIGTRKDYNFELSFAQRFKKAGRTIIATINNKNSKSNSTTSLNNKTSVFKGETNADSFINQSKDKDYSDYNYTGSLIYTEPISSKLSLISKVGIGNRKQTNKIFSFDPTDNKALLDSSYSAHFKLATTNLNAGVQLSYKTDRVDLNLGTKFENNKLASSDFFAKEFNSHQYFNFSPSVKLRFKYSSYKSLELSYKGSPVLPSIQQLQPLVNNEDPLLVFEGNKTLKPAFENLINLKYLSFNIISGKFMGADGRITSYKNRISSVLQTDNAGRTTISYQNISGMDNYQYNLGFNYGKKYSKPDLVLAGIVSLFGNHYESIVNSKKGSTDSKVFGIGPSVTYNLDSVLNINIRATASYNLNKYSQSTFNDEKYYSFKENLNVDLFLRSFKISNQFAYSFEQKTLNFPSYSKYLWNASISYSLKKLKGLNITLTCFDILNNNNGYERSIESSRFIINNYSTINRYFMATIGWKFDNFKQR